MQQTAWLVVNQIMVDGYALLFNCTAAVWASDSMTAFSYSFHKWVGVWWYVFGLARCMANMVFASLDTGMFYIELQLGQVMYMMRWGFCVSTSPFVEFW